MDEGDNYTSHSIGFDPNQLTYQSSLAPGSNYSETLAQYLLGYDDTQNQVHDAWVLLVLFVHRQYLLGYDDICVMTYSVQWPLQQGGWSIMFPFSQWRCKQKTITHNV